MPKPCVSVVTLSVAFFAAAFPAWADLPLTVEEVITDKGKVKLDLSLAYANVERKRVSTGESVVIQTGATSFITLPTAIANASRTATRWSQRQGCVLA